MSKLRVALRQDWTEIRDKCLAINVDHYDVPVNKLKLYDWFEQHLDRGIIFLSDTGFISGLSISDPVRDWDVLTETGWYDTGRSGLKLLRTFIEFGRITDKHDEIRMTTLSSTHPKIKHLLKRMGFEEIEQSHRLTL